MIDFDDIDEAAADLIAAGGELDESAAAALGSAVEGPGEYAGGYLWPFPHNKQFPGWDQLPERLKKTTFPEERRSTLQRIRLFMFYGAGDSFMMWYQFIAECPDWVDVAVYEWPSHGTRDTEEHPKHVDEVVADAMEGLSKALKQHAKGGQLEGAPFALCGHSIGVLIALGVGERAKALYGIEPSAFIVMDRAAPPYPLASDYGLKLLEENDEEFIDIFNPQVSQMAAAAGNETTMKMKRMWCDDIKFQNDTKPEGWHIFRCPVHVFIAMQNWVFDSEQVVSQMDEKTLEWHKKRCAILGSSKESQALWDFERYGEWSRWTNEESNLHQLDEDHAALKRSKVFTKKLWQILSEFKAKL